MQAAQDERTDEFTTGLADPAYVDRFLASRLGSTTHIAVMDADGRAASVTCTNGEGSGVVVPGTGVHVNNIMGEEDLSPTGFHRAAPGTRMPSMMAPTVVLRDGEVELVVGSAGSNRIRSAILQTIVGVVDHGLPAGAAVDAPRVHPEAGLLYTEPGVPVEDLGLPDEAIVRLPRAQPVLRRRPGGRARPRHGRAQRRGRPAARRGRGDRVRRAAVAAALAARRARRLRHALGRPAGHRARRRPARRAGHARRRRRRHGRVRRHGADAPERPPARRARPDGRPRADPRAQRAPAGAAGGDPALPRHGGAGGVRFADASPRLPPELGRLIRFTRAVATRSCGLDR
jgi:hypothetical protein